MSDVSDSEASETRYNVLKRKRPVGYENDMSKKKSSNEENTGFSPVQDEKINDEKDFFAKTMNVKDFCNVLVGFGNIPNLEHILVQFGPQGMMLYGKPMESPVVVTSFWNKSMFQDYKCGEVFKKWVSKSRFENLRKKISKDVEYINISNITEGTSGFKFSGDRLYKTGGKCHFSFNVFEWTCNVDPVEMNVTYSWHVSTSSQKLKDNIDFMDDKSEFISVNLENKSLLFEGISETGLVAERIGHETEASELSVKFNCLFYKRFLKIITSTQALHKTVTISFNPDEDTCVYPVLFSYTLDQSNPQSHFSAYLLPFVK